MTLPLDARRYQQILQSVALDHDIAALDHGDQTLAGENGSRLSGSQKQRVSLARALYSTASCVLLDDCLSAVDSRTANHIFFRAIRGPLMQGRTCILSTHHTRLVLEHARFSVFLEGGCVKHQGNPNELEIDELVDLSSTEHGVDTSETPKPAEIQAESATAEVLSPLITIQDVGSTDGGEQGSGKKSQPAYHEKKSEWAVSWSTILGYLRAAGSPMF
jgi:ABC-type multidrug transport system ATPase subunit